MCVNQLSTVITKKQGLKALLKPFIYKYSAVLIHIDG